MVREFEEVDHPAAVGALDERHPTRSHRRRRRDWLWLDGGREWRGRDSRVCLLGFVALELGLGRPFARLVRGGRCWSSGLVFIVVLADVRGHFALVIGRDGFAVLSAGGAARLDQEGRD